MLDMSCGRVAWHISFDRGKALLSKHRLEEALKRFEAAVASCPVEKSKELSKTLYYLGVTLNKLGMSSCALKSWSSAHRLYKNGYAGAFLHRFSNGYGMARQESEALDDWKAFYSVQLARYLSLKKSRRLGTDAEKDVIWELIIDGWKDIRASVDIQTLSTDEKLRLYRKYEIVFPSFVVPEASSNQEITVDFARRRRIDLEDQCFCGSGLEYKLCCGRTPGEDELENGIL
jgi:tetratricopeptide (TPR) repeat protein